MRRPASRPPSFSSCSPGTRDASRISTTPSAPSIPRGRRSRLACGSRTLERGSIVSEHLGQRSPRWATTVWTDRSPFKRAPHDLVSMLLRAQPQSTGAPAAPAWRALWARAFDASDASGDLATRRATHAHGESIDAAWLAETLLQGDVPSRSERLDQFAFGQRALASTGPADLSDALFVLRSLPRFRMLMLTLERIGVRRPALYAALTRLAEQISDLETTRARAALANFQGAIALVERLVRVRSIDSSTAERLLEALALVPFKEERGFLGGLAPWLRVELRHALRRDGGFEEILVEALAGSADEASIESVSWEGQQYRLDIAATERQRLRKAGAREAGHAIDLAVTLHGLAQRLATDTAASKEIQSILVELNQPAALSSDSRRALESLLSLVDVVVGDALLALNYEVNLNLARGTPRAAAAVAVRHDFGFEIDERRCPCARGMGDAETNRQAQCAVAHRGRGPWARRRRPVSRATANRHRTATAVTSDGWHRERDVRDERGADGSASDAK